VATAGPSFPASTGWDTSIGTVGWTSDGNIVSDNGSYAFMSSAGTSYYLKATNFGFSIPSGATINGVTVRYECSTTAMSVYENSLRLIKAGTISGSDYSTTAAYTGTDTVYTRGGSSDLWSLSLSAADVNDPTFGVGLSVYDFMGGGDTRVDYITIEIAYTAAASGPEAVVVSCRVPARAFRSGRLSVRSSVSAPFDAAAAVAASGGEIVVASFAAVQTAGRSLRSGRSVRSSISTPFVAGAAVAASGGELVVASFTAVLAARGRATRRVRQSVSGPLDVHVDPHPPAVVIAAAGRKAPPRPRSRIVTYWPEDGQGVCDCGPGGVLLVGASLSVTLVNRGAGVPASDTPLSTLQVALASRGTLQVEKVAPRCDC